MDQPLISPNPYHTAVKGGVDQRTITALAQDPTGISLINKYFENLVFYKVEEKDGFGLYVVRVADQLIASGGSRYIIAFVPLQLSIAIKAKLHELPWQNLQLRNLKQSYRIPAQRWVIPQGLGWLKFHAIDRCSTHTTYRSDQVPFELLLLHDEKKKGNNKLQYYNTVHLPAGLDSYGCVLHYIGKEHPLAVTVNDGYQLL